MQAKIQKLALLGVILMLSGCATNQHFDCKKNNGIKCQSLSEIDKRVTLGEIGKSTPEVNTDKRSIYLTGVEYEKTTPKIFSHHHLRTKEEIAQIWVADYETKEGVYHQSKIIHTVLKPSRWVNSANELEVE